MGRGSARVVNRRLTYLNLFVKTDMTVYLLHSVSALITICENFLRPLID
jgi:hypothetical protein